MKKLACLLLLIGLTTAAFAQDTEFSVHFNGGLFSFGGKSATPHSIVLLSDVVQEPNRTNNPYGTHKAFSYEPALQIERATRWHGLFGLEAGYEMLRSHVHLNGISGMLGTTREGISGQTTFKHRFINLYPHIGYRFEVRPIDIDLTVGPEFGFLLSSKTRGKVHSKNGDAYSVHRNNVDNGTDIRLRSSLTIYYNRWGITAGYSYGLHNYERDYVGGSPEVYTRFIRFGLAYRIQ